MNATGIDGVGSAADREVIAARNSVYAAFGINGMLLVGFLSRIPDIRAALNLTPGSLGAALLAVSAGAMIGLPISGRLVGRFGSSRVLVTAGFGMSVGLLVIGTAISVLHSLPVLVVGFFVAGMSNGIYDVSMNLQAALVERRLGRSIMPRFHAAFSVGTVLGALIGALASGFEISLLVHLAVIVALYCALAGWFRRDFLVDERVEEPAGGGGRSEWTRPRTLLIGLIVLAAAFTEGTANDWLATALAEGYDLPRWVGVLGYATFLIAMTLGRVVGTGLLDRYGRVAVLRVLFACAIVGALLVSFGGPVLAFVGAAIWGLGASLGFPVGMSAAADDPERASARMSVVATIGYTAFLAGPPLLGFLGDHIGLLRALLIVGVTAIFALGVLPAAREPDRAGPDGR
ncbi:MFS transporter [Millisia brevis]|uniref:MFS transporter n=1 Tax=Millisia brevis TaxID=264148 RepID=UPI00083273B5|nr:MFS transporter [Millisia brevis]